MIFVLPGMGADNSMYAGSWKNLSDSVFLDWPCYRGEKSISDVAERMIEGNSISTGDILVGSSLGGMVACEIAKRYHPKVLFLLGSARDKNEIHGALAKLYPLISFIPIAALQTMASLTSNSTLSMFRRSEPEFIRAMCRAIFGWEGLGQVPFPVKRIHGKYDRIIPEPSGVDVSLNCGHRVAMHHPEACVDAILRYC